MKTIISYLLIILIASSCDSLLHKRKLSGLELFKTKIEDIKTENFISKTNLTNKFYVDYKINDYKKIQIQFLWKTSELKLSTLELFFGVQGQYYKCIFDKLNFEDVRGNGKLISKTIHLENSKFYSSERKITFNSIDFFNKIAKSNEVFIFATINDISILSNPLLSSPYRSSNVIKIALKSLK